MSTVLFDTLAYTNKLKAAGMPEKQAEAQAEAQKEILSEILESALATKADLEIAKVEIIKWVAGMLMVQASILIGGFFAIIKYLLN